MMMLAKGPLTIHNDNTIFVDYNNNNDNNKMRVVNLTRARRSR